MKWGWKHAEQRSRTNVGATVGLVGFPLSDNNNSSKASTFMSWAVAPLNDFAAVWRTWVLMFLLHQWHRFWSSGVISAPMRKWGSDLKITLGKYGFPSSIGVALKGNVAEKVSRGANYSWDKDRRLKGFGTSKATLFKINKKRNTLTASCLSGVQQGILLFQLQHAKHITDTFPAKY